MLLEQRFQSAAEMAQALRYETGGRAGTSIDFPGRIVREAQWFVASFPGKYEAEWEQMTKSHPNVSVACVFFPDSSSLFFGVHEIDTLGRSSADFKCFCHTLYGHMEMSKDWPRGRAPWGCQVGASRRSRC